MSAKASGHQLSRPVPAHSGQRSLDALQAKRPTRAHAHERAAARTAGRQAHEHDRHGHVLVLRRRRAGGGRGPGLLRQPACSHIAVVGDLAQQRHEPAAPHGAAARRATSSPSTWTVRAAFEQAPWVRSARCGANSPERPARGAARSMTPWRAALGRRGRFTPAQQPARCSRPGRRGGRHSLPRLRRGPSMAGAVCAEQGAPGAGVAPLGLEPG